MMMMVVCAVLLGAVRVQTRVGRGGRGLSCNDPPSEDDPPVVENVVGCSHRATGWNSPELEQGEEATADCVGHVCKHRESAKIVGNESIVLVATHVGGLSQDLDHRVTHVQVIRVVVVVIVLR